jgi:sugar lactone lactonase YvrE
MPQLFFWRGFPFFTPTTGQLLMNFRFPSKTVSRATFGQRYLEHMAHVTSGLRKM